MLSCFNVQPRTLAAMQHRPTSYEVLARHEDGSTLRLAFSQRQTKRVLLEIARDKGAAVLAMLCDWDGEASYSDLCWTFGPVTICYGRTEREASSAEIAQG